MESEEEEIVIVGGGVAGLATALGLHSLVLESSEKLRVTGFALVIWRNAWKALEALGIAEAIRENHTRLQGVSFISLATGLEALDISDVNRVAGVEYELRCVNRKVLLEIIENELPKGTIRFSAKVVAIQNDADFKYLLLLADGTSIKTKVLIGSDGVNSAVAKFLGFKKAVQTGRYAARGFINFEEGHGLGNKIVQLLGIGARHGIIPLDDRLVFWFFNYNPASQEEIDLEHDTAKLKAFILNKLGNTPEKQRRVFTDTELENISCAQLRYRHPWDLVCGNISKRNACVIGDALHPMTPDIAQGACAALEDSVVLARCLGQAKDKYDVGLEKFAKERRWRSIKVISLAYLSGFVNQGQGAVVSFVRDKFLAGVIIRAAFKLSMYDCGRLQ